MSAGPVLAFDDDENALRDSARSFLAAHCPVDDVRKLRDSPLSHGTRLDVWKQIVDMDWAAIALSDEAGGIGSGYFQQGILFEELGRVLALTPMLSVAETLPCLDGGNAPAQSEIIDEILTGTTLITLAHREGPYQQTPPIRTSARRTTNGYRLSGEKRFVAYGGFADLFVVSARLDGDDGDRVGLFLIEATAAGVTVQPFRLIDSHPRAHVLFDDVHVGQSRAIATEPGAAAQILDRCLDIGAALLAAEMLGSLAAALDLTVNHLQTREQFGVRIGSFQALQHRAARMVVAQELTTSAVRAALRALDNNPAAASYDVSAAKVCANEAFSLISREAAQLHGGLGMTDEADIGLYLKRARVATLLGGDSTFHRRRLSALKFASS